MRALALSGGGNRGALQAGAIDALVAAGIRFDAFAGTSVGALNAAFLAADPGPAAAAAAAALIDVWLLDVTGACTDSRPPRTAIDIAIQSLDVTGAAQLQSELACPPAGTTYRHLVLRYANDRWFSDFTATPACVVAGIAVLATTLAWTMRRHHKHRCQPYVEPTWNRDVTDRPDQLQSQPDNTADQTTHATSTQNTPARSMRSSQ